MSDNSKNLSSTKDLKRVLGFWDLMAVGVGSIIGSGIMSLTGWGIDETGRRVCIAFVRGGILASVKKEVKCKQDRLEFEEHDPDTVSRNY